MSADRMPQGSAGHNLDRCPTEVDPRTTGAGGVPQPVVGGRCATLARTSGQTQTRPKTHHAPGGSPRPALAPGIRCGRPTLVGANSCAGSRPAGPTRMVHGGSSSEHRGRHREKELHPRDLYQPAPADRRHPDGRIRRHRADRLRHGWPPRVQERRGRPEGRSLRRDACTSDQVSTTTTGGVVTLVTPEASRSST